MSACCTETRARLTASQPADCVALLGDPYTDCDDQGEGTTVVQQALIGTYALRDGRDVEGVADQPEEERRHGTLDLIEIRRRRVGRHQPDQYSLVSRHVHETHAVLDATSRCRRGRLYAACANGVILRGEYEDGGRSGWSSSGVGRKLRYGKHCGEAWEWEGVGTVARVLNLSVDAMAVAGSGGEKEEGRSEGVSVVASDSEGWVKLYVDEGRTGLRCVDRRKMHDGEAWTSHVRDEGRGSPVVYSGGDDGVLTAFSPDDPAPRFRLRKPHETVGVTTINSNTAEHQLWTGGYDDTVRVWDVRHMQRCLADVRVGGGVWRVRYHPDDHDLALIPAMYHGCAAVRWTAATGELRVVAEYGLGDGEEAEHRSIAYGAEWIDMELGNEDTEEETGTESEEEEEGKRTKLRLALTTSFYDKAVRLWSFTEWQGRF